MSALLWLLAILSTEPVLGKHSIMTTCRLSFLSNNLYPVLAWCLLAYWPNTYLYFLPKHQHVSCLKHLLVFCPGHPLVPCPIYLKHQLVSCPKYLLVFPSQAPTCILSQAPICILSQHLLVSCHSTYLYPVPNTYLYSVQGTYLYSGMLRREPG